MTTYQFDELFCGAKNDSLIGVSGGTSIQFFLRYANINKHLFDAKKIIVIDERDVCDTHPESNYGRICNEFGNAMSVTSVKRVYKENWVSINLDIVIMGFGSDGHFASIFQCFDQSKIDLRVCSFRTIVPVGTPYCIRYSLSEDVISSASKIVLLANSERKYQTIDECKLGRLPHAPLARLLARRDDVQIVKAWG